MHIMLLKIVNICKNLLSLAVYVLMHIIELEFQNFLYHESTTYFKHTKETWNEAKKNKNKDRKKWKELVVV